MHRNFLFWETWKLSLMWLRNSNTKEFKNNLPPLFKGGKELTMVWHTPFVLSLAQVKKERLLCSLHKWIPDAGERWELESRLAKETFFRARFEAKQKPISRPCPSLACLLSSSLFSYGGGALRCTAAATSRQFSSKKSSLSIYFIDNISIRQAVGTEGGAGGASEPPPDFGSCTSKIFSFKTLFTISPLQILSPSEGPTMLLVAASQIMGWGKKRHKCNSWRA